jgi:D-glycero-alpha-D-manno-heptose-7-phosphate kinase
MAFGPPPVSTLDLFQVAFRNLFSIFDELEQLMIITRTPLRVSFFGGGTDYPVWYNENRGAVLSTAIDKYCYITCRRLPPFFDYRSRISYSKVENVSDNQAIEHPSVRGCLEFLKISEGIEIHHVADLPARTGLGTSSAFTVGLLLGLYALTDRMRDKHSLAQDAIHVEQEVVREAVGAQDQVAAAYGGFNHITFEAGNRVEVKPVLARADRLSELQSHMVLFFTGFARTASEIAVEQVKETPKRHAELAKMLEMVDEAIDIVSNPHRRIGEFGSLLHEGWNLKKTLTNKITNPLIDEIYESGREAGAIGGKLLGAGGGGFMLFFVPPDRRHALVQRLRKLLCVPFAFSSRGSHVVVYEPEASYTNLPELSAQPVR